MNPEDSRLRLAVLGVIIMSLFAAMSARLWYLQVLDTDHFQVAAQANQVRLVYEPAPRGRILDRKGRVLVDNQISDVLTISRVDAQRHPEVVGRVAALLGVPAADVAKRIADPRYSPYRPVPLAEGVDEARVVYLREHQNGFPGVTNAQVAVRTYPNGGLAAHVLGYVGEINDRELAARKRDGYRLGEEIGKTGAELGYEHLLRGIPGVTKYEVDSRGNVLDTLGHADPVQGHDVQLTIDLDIQRLTEDSLAQGLEAARRHWDGDQKKHFIAPAGAVVVLDPRDGSVLAMASNPSFEPGAFVGGIGREEFAALQDPAGHFPLNNRAIQGQYAPGSTFKLITAIAGMRTGLIGQHTTIEDTGSLRVGNRTFRNAGRKPWGKVDLPRALAVSSDVYFYKMGWDFWQNRSRYGDEIQEVARELGLGARTGIALPSEARGRVPDPETRARLHKDYPKAFPNGIWYGGDNVNLAIGQGEMVATPLQLASVYATFANGGTVYQPRLAARALRQTGNVAVQLPPLAMATISLPEAIRAPILAGLRGAVANPEGTAHQAFAGFSALQVAGKTGTAQVFGKQDTAIFAAFAPAHAPEYAIAVVMEEAGFGGETAAPVARRILSGLAGEPPGPITLGAGVD